MLPRCAHKGAYRHPLSVQTGGAMAERISAKPLTVYVHPCNDSYMNTTTTTARNADFADVFAAGMPFPMRNALVRTTHASAVALFQARRAFWLAAADTYAAQVAAGCADAAFDMADALAQAERYAA